MLPLRRIGSLVTMLATLLIATGCTGGSVAVSSPSAVATAAVASISPKPSIPTPSPVPSRPPSAPPAPTPVPAAASAIAKLKIGAPYTLVFNPANAALSASFTVKVGSINVTETMSGREIHKGGTTVGLAYVLEFTGIQMSDKVFEGGARGAAGTTGGKLTYGTVLGHKVAYIVTKPASFAMYRAGEVIVMVGAETLSVTKTLLTSLLKSNA